MKRRFDRLFADIDNLFIRIQAAGDWRRSVCRGERQGLMQRAASERVSRFWLTIAKQGPHGHQRRMTRAYRLDASSHEIANTLSAQHGPDPWGGGDLAPGEFAPAVVRSQKTGQRVIRPMVWGYPAPNGIAPDGQVTWVPNVRNLESPFWIGNLRHSELRCLVPATSFMLRATGKSHWFGITGAPVFAMAGIWRDLTDMPVFAILLTASSGLPRQAGAFAMPVILEPEQQDKWLTADWKDAQPLVAPFAGALSGAN